MFGFNKNKKICFYCKKTHPTKKSFLLKYNEFDSVDVCQKCAQDLDDIISEVGKNGR